MTSHLARILSSETSLARSISQCSKADQLVVKARCFSTHHRLRYAKSTQKSTSPNAKARSNLDTKQSVGNLETHPLLDSALPHLQDVASLAKWKQEIARKPPQTTDAKEAIRSLLYRAMMYGKPDVQRYAALFVIKSALLIPPNGIKTTLAVHARSLVEILSAKNDPEAMVLHGQLHEQSPIGLTPGSALLEASILYEDAVKLLDSGRWTKGPDSQLIVTPGDALCAFGGLNINSPSPGIHEEAAQALVRAVERYNHFEACKFLEGHLVQGSAQHYDCILRLAITGHHAAAKKLGDMLACPAEQFHDFDEKVQEDMLGGKRWAQIAHVAYKVLEPDGEDQNNSSLGRWLDRAVKTARYREMIDLRASFPTFHEGLGPFARGWFKAREWYRSHATTDGDSSDNWLAEAAWESERVSENVEHYLARLRADGGVDMRTAPSKIRYFKALDWYKFAALGGHAPAMISGMREASQMCLPWEFCWFYWQWDRLSADMKAYWRDEAREIDGMQNRIRFWTNIIHHNTELVPHTMDMDRLMICGNVE